MAPGKAMRFSKRSKAFMLHILVGNFVSFRNMCRYHRNMFCNMELIVSSYMYFILISAHLVILPPILVSLAVLVG